MSRYSPRTRLSNVSTSSQVSQWFGNQFVETGFFVEYLVIAGGGAGSGYYGGGAGGYRNSTFGEFSGGASTAETPLLVPDSGGSYTVTVGAGGAWAGNRGGVSVFGTVTSSATGSGSGGSANSAGGTAVASQGSNGGNGGSTSGGGGGGAGAAGGNGSGGTGGTGGNGLASSITGTPVTRAGGGGGMGSNGGTVSGGSGGGGNGNNTSPTSGAVNTGSGGGGNYAGPGQSTGGSGIVILRFPSSFNLSVGAGLTSTNSTVGSNKVYIFTAGSGTVTFS